MNRTGIAQLLLIPATALCAAMLSAQASLPDTPSARQLGRWLATFNAADREARQQFVREHWPSRPNQNVDQDMAFRDQTGGFNFLRVEESTPTRTIVLATERDSDTVARLTMEVDPVEPHQILRFGAQAIPRPADLAIARLPEAELLSALRAELDRRARSEERRGGKEGRAGGG